MYLFSQLISHVHDAIQGQFLGKHLILCCNSDVLRTNVLIKFKVCFEG